MRCARCHKDNREGRKFCAHCGAGLGWDCADCGFANAAGEHFCGGCGRPAPGPIAPASEAGKVAAGEPVGERRQVAILFADLSGFTALSAGLDAEELRRLVEGFYGRVEAVVARCGGTVDKHIGDAVMALFGAPIAHGDDALRALRAALDIHAATAELRHPTGAALTAHVGVAMGEVVAGGIGRGYTVLGDAVNLAARLVGLAQPGQTVISDALARQLEGRLQAVPMAPASLKGFEEPVVAWRVDGLALAAPPSTPYVGRETDRRLLAGLLADCQRERRGRVVVLRGEAGIGKSRLVEEIMADAAARGFATYKALVLDFGTGKGQDAMRMLARGLLGLGVESGTAERAAAVVQAAARGLAVGESRPLLEDLLDLPSEGEGRVLYQAMDEATRRTRRRDLLATLVRWRAGERPVLAAVEDLHWADEGLLDDLAGLATLAAGQPLLLVLTTRPEGDPLDRAWRAKLGGAAFSTLDLAPLSQAEGKRLAESLLGMADRRIAACLARAGGNPFFLEQLLRHSDEVVGATVPASIQSLVLARADRLPAAERRALQAASVLGQRLPLAALRHLLEEPGYEPGQLIDQQFMRGEGSDLAFVHALMRDGVYGSLLKTRRRELHRRAASWYEGRDLGLRARHLELAEDAEAAAAYLAAAEFAAASYRMEEGLDFAERGLALPGAPPVRVGLATLQGEFAQSLGRTEAAVAAFRAAAAAAAPGAPRLRAWLGLAHALSVLDRLDEALALLERAEAEAQAPDLERDRSRLHTLRGNIHFPRGEIERCVAEHQAALSLAEAADAPEEQARALGGLGDAYYMRGRYMTAETVFRRCVEIGAAGGFRRIEAANLPMLAIMAFCQLRLGEALAKGDRAVQLGEQIGHRRAVMIGQHARAFVFLEMEQWSEAAQAIEVACDIARALAAPRFVAEGLFLKSQLQLMTGDDRVRQTLAEGLGLARQQPAYILPYGLALAALAAPTATARAAALAEGEQVVAAGAVSHNILFFNRYAIEACLAAGDWPGAERYAAALEEGMAAEPLPMSDFLIARARALAAAGRGRADRTALARLLGKAREIGWRAVLPVLERALAGPP